MGSNQSHPIKANQPRISYQAPRAIIPIHANQVYSTSPYPGYSNQTVAGGFHHSHQSQQLPSGYPQNNPLYQTHQQSYHVINQQNPFHRGSRMAAVPPVDENFLKRVFQQVDKDRSNAINAIELQACLSNGTWEPFNGETVRLMINLFDRSQKGQLNYEEFKQLWKYIEEWRQCFQSFDKDKSGFINKDEIKQALTAFGYQLSDKFYDLILHKFVKSGQAFRHHDTDSDGVITIKYEDFLSLVFSMR